MSKRKKQKQSITINERAILSAALHKGLAEAKRELMRQGVVLKAQTIPNKRKAADKRACRKGEW